MQLLLMHECSIEGGNRASTAYPRAMVMTEGNEGGQLETRQVHRLHWEI